MALLQNIFQHNVCDNNDFTVQTVSETCVQCVRSSYPWHSTNDVSIHRCCDQWSVVAVRATPAWSPASTDYWCQTSCHGRLPPSCVALEWRNPLDFNLGCWGHVRLNAGDILTTQVRAIEFLTICNGAQSCCKVYSWRPLAPYTFIKIKVASRHVLLCVVYMCVKIIKFYRYIQLLQAKMKVGPFNLVHPVGSTAQNLLTWTATILCYRWDFSVLSHNV